MSETYERLAALLRDKFDVNTQTIDPDATLGDLGLDSLAAVELFVSVEQQWNITVDEGEAVPDRSVQEVVSYFDKCAAQSHTNAV
jgi:acyl carrier protein